MISEGTTMPKGCRVGAELTRECHKCAAPAIFVVIKVMEPYWFRATCTNCGYSGFWEDWQD